MSTTIFSFDVFDTCITRPYVAPTDLFEDLAKKTLSAAGLACSAEEVKKLQAMRMEAESSARRTYAALEDISLEQIYQTLADMADPAIDIQQMKSCEIALEIESCSPIDSVLQLVLQARPRGKIVYISDMYLSSDTIRAMLTRCGFWEEGDALYVSNEVGKSKHHSSLYHHVAAAEGVKTADIHHLGDNGRADVQMARITGVKSSLFTGASLTTYERSALAEFDSYAARRFIAINKCIRLRSADAKSFEAAPPASLVHSVIAPLLVVFVAWVLQEAKKRGKERLYFVARDAEVFLKIARILDDKDDSIDCRYLYGSRKAWFAPSLQTADRQEIKWAYEAIMERTPRAILRRLDISVDDFTESLHAGGFTDADESLDDARTTALIDLVQNSEIREAVLHKAKSNHEAVLGYLAQEGLLDSADWSLVDIGWVLNCQSALRRILRSSNPSLDVHGFYLGVCDDHVPLAEGGEFSGYFTHTKAEATGAHPGDWIFHLPSITVVEHLFTPATHGTVLGYRANSGWEPVTNEAGAGDDHQAWVAQFHTMVEEHARALASSGILAEHLDQIMPVANHLLRRFLAAPEKADVVAVSWIKTNAELSHHKEYERPLASPLSLGDLARIMLFELNPKQKRYAHPQHAWLTGSAALSSGTVKTAFGLLQALKRLKGKLA